MVKKDLEHLKWIYERMVYVHKERTDVDYMLKFKDILNQEDFALSIKKLQDNGTYGFGGSK